MTSTEHASVRLNRANVHALRTRDLQMGGPIVDGPMSRSFEDSPLRRSKDRVVNMHGDELVASANRRLLLEQILVMEALAAAHASICK